MQAQKQTISAADSAAAHKNPLASQLSASHATFLAERAPGADEDVHMLAALVDHIIERCSKPGDLVFDPFAGFGTTIERAVALKRRAVGIELLPERVELIQQQVPSSHMIEGDARELLRLLYNEQEHFKLRDHRAAGGAAHMGVDLVLTSPPYMTAEDHEADPLTAYEMNTGDYHRYIQELGLVAAQCAQVVVPGGYVVWNLADIHYRGHTTPLIRDGYEALKQQLNFVGSSEVVWDRYPHDLVADALLVFQRPHA